MIDIAPNHNLRVSYQTAMRTPTIQDMYIGLDGGPAILFGSSPDSVERFRYDFQYIKWNTYTVAGDMVMNNSYRAEQFLAGSIEVADLDNVEPEYVQSREVGYRYNGKKLSLMLMHTGPKYQNFIASKKCCCTFLWKCF